MCITCIDQDANISALPCVLVLCAGGARGSKTLTSLPDAHHDLCSGWAPSPSLCCPRSESARGLGLQGKQGAHLPSFVQGDVAQILGSGPAGHGRHGVGARGSAVKQGVPPQVLEHEGGQALLQLALRLPGGESASLACRGKAPSLPCACQMAARQLGTCGLRQSTKLLRQARLFAPQLSEVHFSKLSPPWASAKLLCFASCCAIQPAGRPAWQTTGPLDMPAAYPPCRFGTRGACSILRQGPCLAACLAQASQTGRCVLGPCLV